MKLPPYVTITKEVGETPLVALTRARTRYAIPDTVPMAYAGRLDPMASGLLLILVGDTCKVQEKYHAFDKTYRVEMLLGVATDTGDLLGLVTKNAPCTTYDHDALQAALKQVIGTCTLPYPVFSSRTVKGKPLHTWALEGRLHEITIPTKTSRIYSCTLLDTHEWERATLAQHIHKKIDTIPPVTDARKKLGEDFRRAAIHKAWQIWEHNAQTHYQVVSCEVTVSSGTYMRALVSLIGEKLGTVACAMSIHRTRIGTYLPITRQHGIWIRSFSSPSLLHIETKDRRA